jgi:hypothetical protein
MQRPTATRVAGFHAWLRLGYCVSRGEKAIRIWAPCPPSRKQLERWRQNGADPDQRPRTFFKLTAVFDRLSRVRSGDVVDARLGRAVTGRSPGLLLLVRAPGHAGGDGLWLARSSRSRRPRATAQRRSRARLAGTPGNTSAMTRCRECPTLSRHGLSRGPTASRRRLSLCTKTGPLVEPADAAAPPALRKPSDPRGALLLLLRSRSDGETAGIGCEQAPDGSREPLSDYERRFARTPAPEVQGSSPADRRSHDSRTIPPLLLFPAGDGELACALAWKGRS